MSEEDEPVGEGGSGKPDGELNVEAPSVMEMDKS
jgi:hypothetical protein